MPDMPVSPPVPPKATPGQTPTPPQGAGQPAANAAPKPAPKPAPQTPPPAAPQRPTASAARIQPRHRLAARAFAMIVALPAVLTAAYLWIFAQDQYVSVVAFSVHSEKSVVSSDLLSGFSALGGSSSKDADILYQYIRSQSLVEELNKRIDLHEIYSKNNFKDPWYTLSDDASIEDMVEYWRNVVRINYDTSSGIIELSVHAFDPQDAQRVAQAIFDTSSDMINRLSAIAREDATRYARVDLDHAIERLKSAREATTAFRIKSQIVDPSADIAGQVGLVTQLQTQLAEALLSLDLLRETTKDDDPRAAAAMRRIEVIRNRIKDEREKFGAGDAAEDGTDYATIVAEFERLAVDQEFAQEAYKLALGSYESARAEALRQSRYLAAHVPPTMAERSIYPSRGFTLLLVILFAGLIWSAGLLVYYSLRDRH